MVILSLELSQDTYNCKDAITGIPEAVFSVEQLGTVSVDRSVCRFLRCLFYIQEVSSSSFFSFSPQVAILDFGSQYSHLIARRVRELHVYCELYSCQVAAEELAAHELTAIILSGGPSSVYDEGAPHVSPEVWKLIEERKVPVLGICYGMQELAHVFGGTVASGLKHEYGKSFVKRVDGCDSPLFQGMPEEFKMWMSHGDKLTKTPEGFKPVGRFINLPVLECFIFVLN